MRTLLVLVTSSLAALYVSPAAADPWSWCDADADCPDPTSATLYSWRSDAIWAYSSFYIVSSDPCTYVDGSLFAADGTVHVVADPARSGPPGAPEGGSDDWLNGSLSVTDYCDGSGFYAWFFDGGGYDVDLVGGGAHLRLTGEVVTYDRNTWVSSTVPISLTWSATGPASWTEGGDWHETPDGGVWWYNWSGTGRYGTMEGTIGDVEISGVSGSMGFARDANFSIWHD